MNKPKPIPTDIGEYLQYDSSTDTLKWIKKTGNRGNIQVGDIAGSTETRGYKRVTFRGSIYKAYRVIWFLQYGVQPPDTIDHINGVEQGDTLENLRGATSQQQNRNRRKFSNNTSGFKGVSYRKASGKFRARIMVNNTHIELGCFDTPEEAHLAYCNAAEKLHGDFANFG